MQDFALQTKITEKKAYEYLQMLLKKRCLNHVSVNLEGSMPVIVLEIIASEKRQPSAEYVVVTCAGCGSSCRVKRGSVSNCEYCGGRVAGES